MTNALAPLANLVAVIDEERCIGCTLCINACPVDAIVGAAKLMHTVIAASCTGCELCVPPCPVDCIVIRSISPRDELAYAAATAEAKRRCDARSARLSEEKAVKAAALREEHATRRKRLTIAKVLERAQERLADRKART